MFARPLTATLAAAVLASASSGGALAAAPPEDVQLTTDYPTVAAQAGDTITFDLEVLAPTRAEMELEVAEHPAEWGVTLRGGGFVVGEVTAAPDLAPDVELEVVIPPSAEPGPYDLELVADGSVGRDDLGLTVNVTDRPVGGIQLSTEFASLRGRPSDTFRYDLDVTNQTPDEVTFAFDASGPDGWNVTAGPASEERASTVTVGAGETESVRVEANPPGNAAAGTYDIVVTATGGGQSGSFTLTAEVTGQPALELSSVNGRLDLTGNAGDEISTSVVVANTGSAPLEDVRIDADEPTDWIVELEPEEIATIAPGSSEEVRFSVQPTENAVAGDYAIGLSATAGGEQSELAYRFTVETSRWWGVIGVAVIAAAFVVLFVVFRRFGRR